MLCVSPSSDYCCDDKVLCEIRHHDHFPLHLPLYLLKYLQSKHYSWEEASPHVRKGLGFSCMKISEHKSVLALCSKVRCYGFFAKIKTGAFSSKHSCLLTPFTARQKIISNWIIFFLAACKNSIFPCFIETESISVMWKGEGLRGDFCSTSRSGSLVKWNKKNNDGEPFGTAVTSEVTAAVLELKWAATASEMRYGRNRSVSDSMCLFFSSPPENSCEEHIYTADSQQPGKTAFNTVAEPSEKRNQVFSGSSDDDAQIHH